MTFARPIRHRTKSCSRRVSKDFVEHGFDIKRLIRTIMNSAAYQRSADANATNKDDNRFYSKYVIRRLPAEVMLDAMSQVLGVPTAFAGLPVGHSSACSCRIRKWPRNF